MRKESCPRLSGKVSTARLMEGASWSRNKKSGFYKTIVNICLSFLNEVKNPGKEYGCQIHFLRLSYAGFFAKSQIMFFLHHHSDFTRRSRMTAEMKCVLQMELNGSCHKRKEEQS